MGCNSTYGRGLVLEMYGWSCVDDNERQKHWKQDPAAVRQDILAVATEVFARQGLTGSRMDEIARRTRTSKRMIYYYFESKEDLYLKVLETVYAKARAAESELDLTGLEPDAALSRLVAFTFDRHHRNPDFIRLVMIENIHMAENMRKSNAICAHNATAIRRIRTIIRRGEASGVFRPGLDATVLHWQISALSFFNVSNRPTFSILFGNGLFEGAGQEMLRSRAVEMVMATVRPEAA